MKLKQLLVMLIVLISLLYGNAENYPYRSDVLWVTVPDHADWIYKTGEEATVDVQLFKYGIPVDNVTLNYTLADDMMPTDAKGCTTLKNGKAKVLLGTMKNPGFRDCVLTAIVDGEKYTHHVKVGFSPEKIEPYTSLPADFDQFWAKNLEDLKKVPLNYTMTPVPKYTTDKMDCWLVNLTTT